MKAWFTPIIAVLVIIGAGFAAGCVAFTDDGLTEAEQRYNEGLDAGEAGRLEEAVALFTEVIELEPSDLNVLAQGYVNRANHLAGLSRFEEGEADLAEACELGLMEAC